MSVKYFKSLPRAYAESLSGKMRAGIQSKLRLCGVQNYNRHQPAIMQVVFGMQNMPITAKVWQKFRLRSERVFLAL
jgi:hypothetical protein